MSKHTVDGGNLAPVDRWFIHVYPIIYRVSTIQDGPGFLTIHSISLHFYRKLAVSHQKMVLSE